MKNIKETDYTIVSKPYYIECICPYCDYEITLPFKEYYWESGMLIDCPRCEEEIQLGDWEYD